MFFRFFQQLCNREMKKFRLPCPSTCYAALTSQIPNFGEKSCKCYIQGQLLSVGIRSLLSAMYWKSSKVRIFWISLQIYLRELLPSNRYVLEMKETDIFRYFQRNFFPPSDSHGRIRNLALFISSLDNCYPESRKNLQVCSPSDSYIFERGKNPNFELLF